MTSSCYVRLWLSCFRQISCIVYVKVGALAVRSCLEGVFRVKKQLSLFRYPLIRYYPHTGFT
jgi:hypothetical protein